MQYKKERKKKIKARNVSDHNVQRWRWTYARGRTVASETVCACGQRAVRRGGELCLGAHLVVADRRRDGPHVERDGVAAQEGRTRRVRVRRVGHGEGFHSSE